MNIKKYLKSVKMTTLAICLMPYIIGTLYAKYRFNRFDLINALLMFLCLIFITITLETVNKYVVIKRESRKSRLKYQEALDFENDEIFQREAAIFSAITMLIALILGFIIFTRSSFPVLIIGIISFIVAARYAFGPIPLSSTPFSEKYAGFYMGSVVLFLSAFIHLDKQTLDLFFFNDKLTLTINMAHILWFILLSIPVATAIKNIFLANNISDIDEDIENGLYTLPIVLGKRKSFLIYKLSYIFGAVAILLMIALKVLPLTILIMIIPYYFVYNNARKFIKKHHKKEARLLSFYNFLFISTGLVVVIFLSILFKL